MANNFFLGGTAWTVIGCILHTLSSRVFSTKQLGDRNQFIPPNQTLIENIMYKSGYCGSQVSILSFLLSINILKMVQTIDQRAINTVRVLAADVVRGANSGHPGTVLLLFLVTGVQKNTYDSHHIRLPI